MPARRSEASATLPADTGAALVAWYREHARPLPWRETDDPWAILVSEVMLQQTRVETVLPRYPEFLRRFPDAAAMAVASEQEVLAAWSGLGYYRRARSLHRLARALVTHHDGVLPDDHATLLGLPGVGAYTAAAVGSIAFGCPRLTIDGNVERVLSRVLGTREEPKRAVARRAFAALMAPTLEAWPPGDVNQALMELGATVCLPRTPSCQACPLRSTCVAYRDDLQQAIPPPRRQVVHDVQEVAAVIEHDGRYLLFRGQRPGALADMWEFPTLDSRLRDAELDLRDALLRYLRGHGVAARPGARLGVIRHAITDRRIRCHVYACATTADLEPGRQGPVAGTASPRSPTPARRWANRPEIATLPVGATVAKVLALIDRA